jgi:SAM-dependent methyltransferase
MDDFRMQTYGDRIADVYDEIYAHVSTPAVIEPMLDVLAELAGEARALELGIGTGRVALPLARRGVEVHGIDSSESMVTRLREKPGGPEIPITLGDLVDAEVGGGYALVYVVLNTFFAPLTQEAQVECFQNVARSLSDGGVFLIEAFVPDPSRFERGQNIQASIVETDRISIDLTRHDPVAQTATSSHLFISESGIRLFPVQIRYAWPSELDLMARLADMRLRYRWGDWSRTPFTAASANHISVYELVGSR